MTLDPNLLAQYPRRYCPVCGNVVRKEFKPGPGGRPNASCPRCRSLERHRFFSILLSILGPGLNEVGVLLEIAPSPETARPLDDLEPRLHVRLDLGADNRHVDVLGSLTQVPMRDASVDFLVCYHVLEHIPDDLAAMREISRVLAPGSLGLIQVPFRPGTTTDEDPDAPAEVRLRRFGQVDHVRYYGDDFEARLVTCGLSIRRITPRFLLGSQMCVWLHLNPDEVVWLVSPGTEPVVPQHVQTAESSLTMTLSALLGEVTKLRGELVRQRGVARGLKREIEVLRSQPARVEGPRQLARTMRSAAGRARLTPARWRRMSITARRRLARQLRRSPPKVG